MPVAEAGCADGGVDGMGDGGTVIPVSWPKIAVVTGNMAVAAHFYSSIVMDKAASFGAVPGKDPLTPLTALHQTAKWSWVLDLSVEV